MDPNTTSQSSADNVTVRVRPKKLFTQSNSIDSVQNLSLNSVESELHMRSLGYLDLSTNDLNIDLLENIKQENVSLQRKLVIANNEIDILTLENNKLQNIISQKNNQLASLKEICKSPRHGLRNSVQSGRKKSRKQAIDNSRFSTPCHDQIGTNLTPMDGSLMVAACSKSAKPVAMKSLTRRDEATTTMDAPLMVVGTPNTPTPPTTRTIPTTTRRIYIFGGRQCQGLASKLIDCNHGCDITAFVKPEANTEQILNTCNTYNISNDDVIVLSVGEHDQNPTKVMTELSATLKLLQSRHVIVPSVKKNVYLNEKLLNNSLKMICAQYPNCNYLDLNIRKKLNIVKNYKLTKDLFDILNLTTVLDRYSNRLWPVIPMEIPMMTVAPSNKNNRYNISSSTYRCLRNVHVVEAETDAVPCVAPVQVTRPPPPRRGTIPFYFSPERDGMTTSITATNATGKDSKKKGTIPFYFNVIKKDDNNKNLKTFFRC